MPKIAIVTDSSACLPAELIRAHRITIVPLAFLFNDDLHHDGSLSSRDFYALLRASRKFPTTAAPPPAAFVEAFRQAAETAEAALCITLPSAFSGTYDSALAAVELAQQELPGFLIRVVDSHCLAMCHGFAVLAAARAAEKGASIDTAEAVMRDVAAHSYLIGALDTLRYLAKSGRVPIVIHWATSLLRIKPIMAANGEAVRAVGRVRTMPRALDRLLSHLEQQLDGERPLHMAVMHADAPTAAADLSDTIRRRFDPEELLVTEFTSVMGAHTGPGFVGVAFFSGEPTSRTAQAVSSEAAHISRHTLQKDVTTLESSLADPPPRQTQPALVLVSGLPGSGKSHLSRELAKRYPLVHLNTDALRRALFPHPTHGAAESARLFSAVHAVVDRLLSRGAGVILDATNLKAAHRRPLYDIAERAEAVLVIVHTEAPPEVARHRLESRAKGQDTEDASEATVTVYNRMRREAEPIERQHIRVDTSQQLEPALQEIVRRLKSMSERLVR
jgi:DegV family protein with EDD domain